MNDSALGVLKQLDTQQEYLFINQQTGKPYTTITKVWDRLRKAAGLPHLHLHDLRYQFADFLVNNLYIDTIQHWAGNFATVACNLVGDVMTFAGWVAQIATRA